MARSANLRLVSTSAREIDLRLQGRVPPHDLDAEAAVIAAILLAGAPALDRVQEILKPLDLYSSKNGWIYEAALELHTAGKPIDVISVADVLREKGRLADVDGPSYLAELADKTPAVLHVEHHAAIVLEHARQRRYIAELWLQLAEGYAPPLPGSVWRDQGAARLNALAEATEKSTSVSVGEGLARAQEKLDERRPGEITGLPTGFAALDQASAGMHPAEVTLVGGPTGRGKTSFAISLAVHVALTTRIEVSETIWAPSAEHPEGLVERVEKRTDRGVIVFCLDNMSEAEIATRMACGRGKVDSIRLKNGEATPNDWQRFTGARAELEKLPILLECHTALTPLGVRAKIRAGKAELLRRWGAELSLVVIDYFQLLGFDDGGPSDRDMNQEQKLNRNALSIVRTAKAFEVPILMLVQENDGGEVRDCKAAAMHAQNRWTITWKDTAKRAAPPGIAARPHGHPATITIKKCRNGRLGPCQTYFYPQFTLFTDEAP